MLQHGPLLVGMLAILGLTAYLAVEEPNPGRLARPHAAVAGLDHLDGCTQCHAPEGLDAGCLGCHVEIRAQRTSGHGYHAGAGAGKCAGCHPEHNGDAFQLVEAIGWPEPRKDFEHDHVTFVLHGAHDGLECAACHDKGRFTLAEFPDHPRSTTYLGLAQDCLSCHGDVHQGGLLTRCTECHDQERFKPATTFDHALCFRLEGKHAEIDCAKCHDPALGTAPGLAYHKVKGKTCRDCHADPHRAQWDKDCDSCHRAADPLWATARETFPVAAHARTDFPLAKPHDAVACAKCHDAGESYEQRFRPRAPASCEACHADPHAGQFVGRHERCLDCHEATRFKPARYGLAEHKTFVLRDAHRKVACEKCHTVDVATNARRFTGTPQECRSCHEDPHQGQFTDRGCATCHDEKRFVPARYALAEHTKFALKGAHLAVACVACHEGEPRRFVGTERQCKSCHADPHGGQFAREMKQRGDCTACHRADAVDFTVRPFDHAKRTNYPLVGAHAQAACVQCHVAGKDEVRRYRGISRACADCHRDEHRGQFARGACTKCHSVGTEWRVEGFDHAKQTRFVLDGTHKDVACAKCHPAVAQSDGSKVVQYKPLGTECRDCHETENR